MTYSTKILIVILFGLMLTLALLTGGCRTEYANNHWPYQGDPTIGTNAVPRPEF